MRYNSSGYYEEKISLLGLEVKSALADEKGEPSREKCAAFLKSAFEKGVTFFFVPFSADEETKKLFGENLCQKIRREYFLCGGINLEDVTSLSEISENFEKSLSMLKSGFFDYFVIENIGIKTFSFFTKNNVYPFFTKLKEKGKIKHLGFSLSKGQSFDEKMLSGFLEDFKWDFAKIDLNFYSWDYLGTDDLYRAIRKKGIPFIASDPFMGGMILDPPAEVFEILKEGDPLFSMEEWALRWFFDKKGLLCVTADPKNREELLDFAEIMSGSKTLNSSKKHFVKLASQKFSEEKCEGEIR